MIRLTYSTAAVVATACTVASLPPSTSRSDGGPVMARGVVTHEARSQLRLYRDAAGCESIQTMNRQFRLVTVRPPGGAARRLVLEEGSDVRRCLTSESASSEATVTGWRPDSATKAPLFQITGRGVPGEPIGNLYQMAAVGCCGSQDLFTYFSLLTGRPLFSSSLAVVTFERAEPGATRFAGVHDTFSAGSPPEVEADSSVIAVIGWSDEEGPLQRIAVHADRPEPFAAAAIGLRHPGVRAAARTLKVIPKDSAAKVELQVDLVAPGDDRRVAIRIPIDGLVLHPEAATLSPGIRLRPLP